MTPMQIRVEPLGLELARLPNLRADGKVVAPQSPRPALENWLANRVGKRPWRPTEI